MYTPNLGRFQNFSSPGAGIFRAQMQKNISWHYGGECPNSMGWKPNLRCQRVFGRVLWQFRNAGYPGAGFFCAHAKKLYFCIVVGNDKATLILSPMIQAFVEARTQVINTALYEIWINQEIRLELDYLL